jgi:hypothetical protein
LILFVHEYFIFIIVFFILSVFQRFTHVSTRFFLVKKTLFFTTKNFRFLEIFFVFCQKTIFFTTKNFHFLKFFLFFSKHFLKIVKFSHFCFILKNLFQFMQSVSESCTKKHFEIFWLFSAII